MHSFNIVILCVKQGALYYFAYFMVIFVYRIISVYVDMPNRRQAKTKHANGKNNCPATAMKPVSKMKSSSAGNVQGQISVMRDKLQSFHRTSALHSSLCSSTLINSNVIGDKFDVSSVSAISGPGKTSHV